MAFFKAQSHERFASNPLMLYIIQSCGRFPNFQVTRVEWVEPKHWPRMHSISATDMTTTAEASFLAGFWSYLVKMKARWLWKWRVWVRGGREEIVKVCIIIKIFVWRLSISKIHWGSQAYVNSDVVTDTFKWISRNHS